MAMNECPNCGKPVFDKAIKCIHCGIDLSENNINFLQTTNLDVKDTDKKWQASSDNVKKDDIDWQASSNNVRNDNIDWQASSNYVGNDGIDWQASNENVRRDDINFRNPKKHIAFTKKKKKVIAMITVLAIIICSVTGIKIHQANVAAEQMRIEKYGKILVKTTKSMITGGYKAADCGNLFRDVWYNSIFEEDDVLTNKYTKPNGYFYDDFNDALDELRYDENYLRKTLQIESNMDNVQSLIKKLQNPPDEYKNTYDKLLNMYDNYIKLINLVIDPSGNLETFTTQFVNADKAFFDSYDTLKLYLSEDEQSKIETNN